MKRIKLIKLAFLAFLVMNTSAIKAQLINLVEPTFLVNSPSGIAGVKNFTMANDGDASNTGNWGRAIDSFWFNIPVAIPSNDTLGCSSLPSGSMAGKFALISRGNCQFSEKAYYAQLAGAIAVIIYNNVSGGPVGMAAGNNAASVNIPVIMISQSDGLAMKAQIINGQSVNASLTNWGFGFTHDLGIVNNSMALFHNMAIPKYELDGDTNLAYRSYLGALVGNFGTSGENNLMLKSTVSFTPSGGSSTVLLQDSTTASAISTQDSVIEMLSTRSQVIPTINNQKGTLNFNYALTSSVLDDQTGNNSLTYTVDVTDSIYSKGRLNANGEPIATIGYRYSGNFVNTWGPLYYVNNGGHFAKDVQFTVSNGDNTTSLDGKVVTVYVFTWTDGNSNTLVDAGELNFVGAGFKNFTITDSNYNTFTLPILSQPQNQPLALNANTWYWFAAEVSNDLYLGCDGGINYFMRSYTATSAMPSSIEYWAPQFQGTYNDLTNSTDHLTQFPFQTFDSTTIGSVSFVGSKGLVPAISVRTTSVIDGIKDIDNNILSFNLFPNPATNNLNIEMDKSVKDVNVTILDAVGKVVYKADHRVNNGNFTIDVSKNTAGNYFVILRNGDVINSSVLTITK